MQKRILPILVIAQFACTSLWFAGNAVMGDLAAAFHLPESALGHLTSAVQLGFIAGTLVFALLTLADRFSPSKVFLISALAGALFNACTLWSGNTFFSLLGFRFLTGFCLAGIYPVGMKIAADHFEKGLGKSLGFLVGALVLGTAFPHLLKGVSGALPWRNVLLLTSGLAAGGGIALALLVPDGPYRKASQQPDFTLLFKVFKNRNFRAAAFGYFGHMWELYAFWAFVPVLLFEYQQLHPAPHFSLPLTSFAIIAMGGPACVVGGLLSRKWGARRIASIALMSSGICCLISPLVLLFAPTGVLLVFLLFWGAMVVADSPLFSTLVAQNAVSETRGTALTIVNSLGFAVTIGSIQLLGWLSEVLPFEYLYLCLAIGPGVGLLGLFRKDTPTINNPKKDGFSGLNSK